MEQDTLRALSGIGLFKSLSLPDQQHLASLMVLRNFNPEETIVIQGDEGHGLYLIRSGKVKICAVDPEGSELIFTFLSDGDIIGEIALLDGQPRSATAVAVTPTSTFYLPRREFLDFLKTSPRACLDIIASLCKTLRRLSTRLEEVSFLDVSGRVARNLISLSLKGASAQNCTISQEELGKVVGASRVMINKVLNSFCDLGYIALARKMITILNENELKRLGDFNSGD